MFDFLRNIFKRTKVEDWEKQFLINVFNLLGDEYLSFEAQIDENLLSNVSLNSGVRPNRVSFSYNANVVNKYEQKSESTFTLKGIKAFDLNTNSYIDFEIYISHGLITGYSTPKNTEFRIDVNKIKIDDFRREFWGCSDYKEIETLINDSEHALINPNDVYKLIFNGTIYYHIQDLEDGDFIGIDRQKNVYVLRHDPFAIKLINKPLEKLLAREER